MSPTLKFRLSWSNEPAGPMVERPRPLMSRDNSDLETTHRKDKGYKSNRGSTGNGINSTSNEGLSNNHGIQSGGITIQEREEVVVQAVYQDQQSGTLIHKH